MAADTARRPPEMMWLMSTDNPITYNAPVDSAECRLTSPHLTVRRFRAFCHGALAYHSNEGAKRSRQGLQGAAGQGKASRRIASHHAAGLTPYIVRTWTWTWAWQPGFTPGGPPERREAGGGSRESGEEESSRGIRMRREGDDGREEWESDLRDPKLRSLRETIKRSQLRPGFAATLPPVFSCPPAATTWAAPAFIDLLGKANL
ncbi:hypothetical protein CSOJ01_00029 [Colletotrichum sojae]|uniref:Uncharacterized protein n=1 Tax=Colletotrichum sojae TaxID=2175907 RepID=A0A8H6JZ87_9PEZI|nr:hypothetical protein CSOJ01_00029 [Colletotrichum sojae]